MPDISTQIGRISLKNCLYNASGPRCTTTQELDDLGRSLSGAILTKSCTAEPREGNPSPRYVDTDWGSINSMGLPNEGYLYYAQCAAAMAVFEKPYIVSVSGMTLEENLKIIQHLQTTEGITAIELNLSCPNIVGKPQTGYDFDQMRRVLDAVAAYQRVPLGVKLPPYFDIVHFQQVASILNSYPIAFVTCINSIGNGLVLDIDTEAVVIRPKEGLGGIGGDYIKPTALANVRMMRQLLRPQIAVIGCGGVKSGRDAFEHILCGADAVQVGTQLAKEGVGCLERIAAELRHIMQQKGYSQLSDFKGQLRILE